ncbi:MAG: hypothetical protein EGQ14_04525 [Spirochaetia bacterium]|uniref:hypothetical protein n=1 Tax=Candidatus Avelusimicrobium fimicolum TaxID=3416216 RepID=UPI003CBDBAA5|nr:hypothetical protein [Spirochaetia bacterium]MBD9150060.1 hypothetical protein [Spirochaetia bacterium]
MPEEKDKKKSLFPFLGASDAKKDNKDSFTFSDKIKNSKPMGSKSFANRVSSKIGSDGKPRQTLFERTRRDAPFFIAALVALLLLPFLYKYSGQVSEEPMVTPGSEESVFDPERYGFDTATGNPDGQIAQFAGRDSLSLIKMGDDTSATDEVTNDYIPSHDGYDASQESSTSTEVEENNTNIYKRAAAPATRAAFRRAATKINPLSSAGLTSRGGSRLGVGMWGGGMKTAARKVGASGPRNSPKPVSLQPLQAAGKPSRTSFGNGSAAEARRSKDAMSKANAMQALMDAQMKPVQPGKIGGLGGGNFGPGGGKGNLDRKFTYNGKEPWWWDMMKTRAQKEWEAEFNRKWDWIKWKDNLLKTWLAGAFNCLVTGDEDGAMGKVFGAAKGAGNADKCGKYTEDDWKNCADCMNKGKFGKASCWALFNYTGADGQKNPWSGGNQNSESLGFFSQRIDCLSNGLGGAFGKMWRKLFGKNKGTFAEAGDCNTFAKDGIYTADFDSTKDAGKWTVFHYVVGIPTNRLSAYYQMTPTKQAQELVVGYIDKGTTFNSNISAMKDRKNFVPLFVESVAIKNKKIRKDTPTPTKASSGTDTTGAASGAEVAPEEVEALQTPIKYTKFLGVLRKGGIMKDAGETDAKDSLSVSTKGAKQGKGFVTGARCPYPLVRITCENHATVSNQGAKIDGMPYAHLTFTNGMSGDMAYNLMKSRFLISYSVQGQNNDVAQAITTSTDIAQGQYYDIPHMDIQKYTGSWSTQMTGPGFVTNSLGTERTSDLSEGYQVIANSANIKKLRGSDRTNPSNRTIITWEIRQCDSLSVDGKSINEGGCQNGVIKERDEKGNVTGILGQDRPGRVVSTATCVYDDGGGVMEVPGFPTITDDNPVDNDPPVQPEAPKPEPGKVKLDLANYLSGNGGIPAKYNEQGRKDVGLTIPTVFGFNTSLNSANCRAVGLQRLAKKDAAQAVFNNSAAKSYVDSVLAAVNADPELTAKNTEVVHSGEVSVGQLVDAMTIAYQKNLLNREVPIEVVCSLGKTIGYTSVDPDARVLRNVWRNTFGAFAAYTGVNSSFYPAPVVPGEDGKEYADRRFWGCNDIKTSARTADEEKNADGTLYKMSVDDCKKSPRDARCRLKNIVIRNGHHYGNYNWNGKYGPLGQVRRRDGDYDRNAYKKALEEGGWTTNADDPNAFPLHAIADVVERKFGFTRKQSLTADELKTEDVAGLDDYNRREYVKAYRNIFNDVDKAGCQLDDAGTMPVADALRYIGAVCTNGKNKKPGNGMMKCGTVDKVAKHPGSRTLTQEQQ